MNFPVFIYDRGTCALQKGIEITTRERVLAIVKNSITQKYLIVEFSSNYEIGFVAGGIEDGDSKEQTLRKELFEESGIQVIDSIQEMPERYFEVKFYSPHRNKNYHNKTHVFIINTSVQELNINDEEKVIQTPFWKTLSEIKQKVDSGKRNTNYETMEYLVGKIEESNTF